MSASTIELKYVQNDYSTFRYQPKLAMCFLSTIPRTLSHSTLNPNGSRYLSISHQHTSYQYIEMGPSAIHQQHQYVHLFQVPAIKGDINLRCHGNADGCSPTNYICHGISATRLLSDVPILNGIKNIVSAVFTWRLNVSSFRFFGVLK